MCKRRPAAVLGARWRVRRTPPGSESGACLHRGRSGTWESHRPPWASRGVGDRVLTGPGGVWGFQQAPSPHGSPRTPGAQTVAGHARQAQDAARGWVAVVASPSPGASGAPRPTGPRGGQATSGRACNGQTHARDVARTHRVTRPPWDCTKGQQRLCLRHRMRAWRTSGSVGGAGWATIGSTRHLTASSVRSSLAPASGGR